MFSKIVTSPNPEGDSKIILMRKEDFYATSTRKSIPYYMLIKWYTLAKDERIHLALRHKHIGNKNNCNHEYDIYRMWYMKFMMKME
jgi:hypothetical protein